MSVAEDPVSTNVKREPTGLSFRPARIPPAPYPTMSAAAAYTVFAHHFPQRTELASERSLVFR